MKKIVAISLVFTLLFALNVKASHIAGAEITYDCLGNNQYRINLKLYWDCTGGFDPLSPQTISLSSSCGGNLNLDVHQTNPGGTDISQLCHGATSTCTTGGTNPGYKMNIYTDTITLAPCNTWTMSWSNCCRNAAITNLSNPGSDDMYVQAILNSVTSPCDHSPYFTSQPLPFLCVNQGFCYNYGVVEQDGDSLYYSLISAMAAGGTPLAYNSGYTATAPIAGITINPNSGQISFTPASVGNFVVVVQVAEYTPSGNLIGSIMRDIQFVVYNCNNQTVGCSGGSNITNLTGSATQTGPNSIQMCESSAFTFQVSYTDPNAGDSLTILSNITTVLPGSTITTTGVNPIVATIGWAAPPGSSNTNTSFSITVKDNACPVPGQQTFVYVIKVLPRTSGGPDQIICGNQTAALHGTGGNTFSWNVLSGHPMVVGTNFSCNTCANPIASPDSTTTYEVVSNLGGTCINKDTITVTVVQDFSFNTTNSTDTLCLQQLVQMNLTGPPAGSSYLWTPSTYLNNVTIANPTATVTVPGTYNYYVKIISPLGCIKRDTTRVTILPYIRTRTGRDTILCSSQSTPLIATGGTSFTWSVISGPPLVVGTNFSCNPCASPIASPTAPTTYQVTSNLNGTCINKDTVTITVVPNYTISMSQSETITCLAQPPIQLNATISPAGTYTYQWGALNSLNNYAIPNPLANGTVPGIHVYVVTVTNAAGCVKKDSATITITPSYPPNSFAYGSPTPICIGDTIHLGVTFGNTIPATCGTNPVGCSGSIVATIGNGTATNGAHDYPAPYGNYWTSAKQQFLFRATELHAAGITGGKIDQIDFNVTQIVTGAITTYQQYTINMGCTNATALGNSWISGLHNVYIPKTFNVATGWNTHHFDNAFEWDGISNVIIEICFNQGPPYPNYSQPGHCSSPYTTTTFVSCSADESDSESACPILTPGIFFTNSNNRPNVKFHYCGGAVDSSKYTYSWFPPNAGIIHPHTQTTGAVLPGTTNYYVIVTDTVSGCLDTAHINIIANTPVALHVNAGNDTTICPNTSTTLTATGAPNYTWSPPTGLTSTNTAITQASPAVTTIYRVIGTGHCTTGPSRDSVKVSVLTGSQPHVSAGSDHEVCGTAPFDLFALNTDGYGGNSYVWTLISGTTTDSIHNSHSAHAYVIPTKDNTNTYLVTVKDTCGNTTSDQVIVTVHLGCKLTIPNVFTPNGDGINDNFIVSGIGLTVYSITIYDRWGLKLFESNEITKSWDGKNAEDGTYYYVIKAESASGKKYDEKGYFLRVSK